MPQPKKSDTNATVEPSTRKAGTPHDCELAKAGEWRLLIDGARSPSWNMAIDRAILDSVVSGRSGPTLRFYTWSKPAVTLGFHQKPEQVLDLETVKKAGIEIVIRPTGGRVVLHGDDLTYSVALPGTASGTTGITRLYRLLSEGLQAGFLEFGLHVELAKGNRGELHPGVRPCFSSTARYELLADGRKLVGSAQRRYRGGVLQQGSIPVRTGAVRPEDLMPIRCHEDQASGRWTTVEAALGAPVDCEILARALAVGFEKRLGISFVSCVPTRRELRTASSYLGLDS